MASEYGWSAREVNRLTDELLVLYLDEASDRKRDTAQGRFDSMVEAARAGAIFASGKEGQRQYDNWRSAADRRDGRRPANSATLEQLARDYPDHVGRPN